MQRETTDAAESHAMLAQARTVRQLVRGASTSPRLVDSSTQTDPPPVTASTGMNVITCATALLLL